MEHGKMLKLPCYMAKTTLNELHSDLHKYSHSFSNFNDIIIQFFQKVSVMTMATLVGVGLIRSIEGFGQKL
jgi:hypothetical protein